MVIKTTDATKSKPLLIIPSTIKILAEIDKANAIGTIEVVYPTSTTSTDHDNDEEFDEDVQLYKAMAARASAPTTIAINDHDHYLLIVVPALSNPIEYNLIAQEIVNTFTTKVVCVTPCAMNHYLAWLGKSIKGIPQLVPPASITGIGAAVALRVLDVSILAVNGEGPPGYERVLPDALVDVSYHVATVIPVSTDYPKKVSNVIRKLTDSMYL